MSLLSGEGGMEEKREGSKGRKQGKGVESGGEEEKVRGKGQRSKASNTESGKAFLYQSS